MRIRGVTLAVLAAAAALSQAAQAATFTVYTDRAAFLAAAGAVSVETFDNPDQSGIPFLNQSINVGAFKLTDYRTERTPGYSQIGTRPIGGQTVNGTRFVETFGYGPPGLDGGVRPTFDTDVRAFGAEFVSGSTIKVQLLIDGQSFIKKNSVRGGFSA